MHRGVINQHAAPGHHLFQVAQTQRVGCGPAHTRQDHLQRVVQPPENWPKRRGHALILQGRHSPLLAALGPLRQNPKTEARTASGPSTGFRTTTLRHGPPRPSSQSILDHFPDRPWAASFPKTRPRRVSRGPIPGMPAGRGCIRQKARRRPLGRPMAFRRHEQAPLRPATSCPHAVPYFDGRTARRPLGC